MCELLPCCVFTPALGWCHQLVGQHGPVEVTSQADWVLSRRLTRHPLEHWWFSHHPALSSQSTIHVFTKEDGTWTVRLERPWEHTGRTAFAGLSCFCSWLIDIHYRLRIFPELSLGAQEDKIPTFLFFPCHGLQLLQGYISFRTHFPRSSSLPLPRNSPLIVCSCLWKIWATPLLGLNLNIVILFQ